MTGILVGSVSFSLFAVARSLLLVNVEGKDKRGHKDKRGQEPLAKTKGVTLIQVTNES